ncbi:peptidase domain-containing ABC transporter [Pseudolactococcus yaeyamensis]
MRGIKQHEQKDCGIACLATIFRYYGIRASYVKLRELAQVDANGSSLLALTETARHYGFESDALQGSIEELQSGIQSGELKLPIIAHIIKDEVLEHYVVIRKVTVDKIMIFDPAKQEMTLDLSDFINIWTGFIITLSENDDLKKVNESKNRYQRYFSLIFTKKKYLLGTLLSSFFLSGVAVISSQVYQKVIDGYILNNATSRLNAGLFQKFSSQIDQLFGSLNQLFFAFIVICIVQVIFYVVRNLFILRLSKKIDTELMNDFFEHLTDLPVSFFTNRTTGDILSRFQDLSDLRYLFSSAGIGLVMDFFTAVVGAVILWEISIPLFQMVLVILAVYLLVTLCYFRPIKKLNFETKENYAKVLSQVKEAVDGIETFKSVAPPQMIQDKFSKQMITFLNKNFKLGFLENLLSAKIMGVESIGILAVLWMGSHLVLAGTLSLGALISFETLVYFFMAPMKNLIDTFPMIQKAMVSLERAEDVFETTREMATHHGQEKLVKVETIAFEKVSFAYGYRENILDNLSFTLKKGKTYGFIGSSGNGKSTIMKLMSGLTSLKTGMIFINQKPISDFELSTLRHAVHYLSQNVFLFNGRLRDNLFLKEELTNTTLLETVYKGCVLDEFIGLDTFVSDNAQNLSGGQKQRIALARALLQEPSVLILDEAINQLDQEMGQFILNFIRTQFPEMMLIQIVHNHQSLLACQDIFEITQGKLLLVKQV